MESELLTARPDRFTSEKKPPAPAGQKDGWGLKFGLDRVQKRQISTQLPGLFNNEAALTYFTRDTKRKNREFTLAQGNTPNTVLGLDVGWGKCALLGEGNTANTVLGLDVGFGKCAVLGEELIKKKLNN
jgi:hypothetical protein